MNRAKPAEAVRGRSVLPSVFAGLFGALLGMALLKFGSPPVMEKMVSPPTDIYEVIFGTPWPIGWAYGLLAGVAVVGLFAAGWNRGAPVWLVALPLVWLAWQFVAAAKTVDWELTSATLKHFTACAACFYLAFFALSFVKNPAAFWSGLLVGFVLVLLVGFQQHFGGLEETRRYFYLYVYPQSEQLPPEYLKRISSDRIFATLFYPNSLAGALLLLLPPMLAVVWLMTARLTPPTRWVLVGLVGLAGLACLLWSGSKAGWLIMLLVGLLALLRLPFGRRFRSVLLAAVLLAGLAGFFWKYSGFFKRGATSVVARLDYWRAAVQTAVDRPLFGTGPGTFAIAYQAIKRPESEMARLAHNDFLQQASDSGVCGGLTYLAFLAGGLWYGWRKTVASADWLKFAVWLGLSAWSLQGLVEFNLYIPALGWPAFALLGWLLGNANPIDKGRSPG